MAVAAMSGGGQVLSADAIAALVDAAREGRPPEETPTAAAPPRMRTVDFTRPTKFTSEQERRLKRSSRAFCRTASTRLSAELRVPIELEVIASTQLTWSAAQRQVPANSITAVIDASPIGTRLCSTCRAAVRARRARGCCSAASPGQVPKSAS